jgi:hypothetical protein
MGVAGLALLAGAVVIYRSAQPEAPPETRVVAERPAPAPVTAEPAAVEPATPAPAVPTPAPPRTRRESTARPSAAPAGETPAAVPALGTLTITADVPGAQVFLDRQFVGTAPLTASDVAPGSHQLNVSAPGHDPFVQTIEVAPGPRDIAIRFRDVRLDLTLDVIHKHRLGSCRGRLIAMPQGLRYDTIDKNDAFAVGLADLEAFQVDYLAKTLTIQPRGGRRYDFTDPDGNADRLFVFHRDVDKVRARLKQGDVPR